MVDIRVPFGGFYNSMHSNSVDEMVKSHTSWLLKETGAIEVKVECFSDFCDEEPDDIFVTAVSDCIDYGFVFEKIAQKYVEHFVKETCFGTLNFDLKFKGLWSPKEYNFHTDQITATISNQDFRNLFQLVSTIKAFELVLKNRLTLRPGFVPHHSNDKDWWIKNFTKLTDDQKYILGLLMLEAVALDNNGHNSDWEYKVWESMCCSEVFGNAIGEFCNGYKAAYKIGLLVQDQVVSEGIRQNATIDME